MSFIETEDIIALGERLIKQVCAEVLQMEVVTPFPRMTYAEAMARYGVDKPDTRYGMELSDITSLVTDSGFPAFDAAVAAGGSVRGILAENCANLPRKQIDTLTELAKLHKAKGLATVAVQENGEIKSTLSKFLTPEVLAAIAQHFNAKSGDLILIVSDPSNDVVFNALGALRIEIAHRMNLADPKKFNFLWVIEFPLLEWSEEDARYYARHHPFTAPMDADYPLLQAGARNAPELANIRAKAYDMVLNGFEIGGGSIRIHQRAMQSLMFKTLGFTEEQAQSNFSFLLEALKYGTPPHGGIAFGFDRIVMLFSGADALREVILFPKVKDASCPLTDAPSTVEPAQLKELGLQIL
jgi:aspartyl-tRNA synthetase